MSDPFDESGRLIESSIWSFDEESNKRKRLLIAESAKAVVVAGAPPNETGSMEA